MMHPDALAEMALITPTAAEWLTTLKENRTLRSRIATLERERRKRPCRCNLARARDDAFEVRAPSERFYQPGVGMLYRVEWVERERWVAAEDLCPTLRAECDAAIAARGEDVASDAAAAPIDA